MSSPTFICTPSEPQAPIVKRGGDAGMIWKDVSGRADVPHGFRSKFRVRTGETNSYPREVVEAALAHALREKVEAANARTDLMEKRRILMSD